MPTKHGCRKNLRCHQLKPLLLLLLFDLPCRSCRLLAHLHLVAGGEALWVFCCCAATTHLLSSLTHVYPDDHFLEKLDHIGIVALIVGTPLTQMMVSSQLAAVCFFLQANK
jgi:predicted membrane channel-forming protein YqfA (hemolysin III family)